MRHRPLADDEGRYEVRTISKGGRATVFATFRDAHIAEFCAQRLEAKGLTVEVIDRQIDADDDGDAEVAA